MTETEEFLKIGTQEWPSSVTEEVRLSKKSLMIAASWSVGLLIACPNPRAFHLISIFPAGLTFAILKFFGDKNPNESIMVYGGWLIYIILVIVALAMTRKKWFYGVWLFMTLLLIFNGVSCHAMLK
jgi:hypothetical protein